MQKKKRGSFGVSLPRVQIQCVTLGSLLACKMGIKKKKKENDFYKLFFLALVISIHHDHNYCMHFSFAGKYTY